MRLERVRSVAIVADRPVREASGIRIVGGGGQCLGGIDACVRWSGGEPGGDYRVSGTFGNT